MKIHKLAKYFPRLEGEEFEELVEDIKKNGQRNPIIIFGGEILDGRNRNRACKKLGIEPLIEEYEGKDPLGLAISMNLRRRHLTVGQRAMLGLEILPEVESEAKERQGTRTDKISGTSTLKKVKVDQSTEKVAKKMGVSRSSVEQAKKLQREAEKDNIDDEEREKRENDIEDIKKGKKSLNGMWPHWLGREADSFADEMGRERKEKAAKEPRPRAMAEYFNAVKFFRQAISRAYHDIEFGRFSPESIHMIKTKHKLISECMTELEGKHELELKEG